MARSHAEQTRVASFSARVLRWYDHHGRHDLPWQKSVTPYRVWVSEIMLQQTQVATVVGYFERFMARFPDVAALAAASQDDVLALWSGLGYYARARNLHKAAREVVKHHNGTFLRTPEALMTLPGVGRSTAAAVASLSFNQSHAILDGNVKRVLARHHGVSGWPGRQAVAKRLWAWAETHTPNKRGAAYTQAMMDLGATVCTRRQPRCDICPLRETCKAYKQGRQHEWPAPRPRRKKPTRETVFLVVRRGDGVLLEKRPPAGIWGGLWSLPELGDGDPHAWCQAHGLCAKDVQNKQGFTHEFTHFRLHGQLVRVMIEGEAVADSGRFRWYRGEDHIGLPAPIRKWLDAHQTS